MRFNLIILFFLSIVLFFSCKEEKTDVKFIKTKPNKVVLISINAPEKYVHLIKQDSVGKKTKDSLGPKSFRSNNGFTYLDYMNNVQTWKPKPKVRDTIAIECYNEYLELTTNNFFTSIKESFLVKNGDTIVFNYVHNIPIAKITNRTVNDIELNYNRYRLKKLFNNKYSSHYLIFGHLLLNHDIKNANKNSIAFYNKAINDYTREIQLLDSLFTSNKINEVNHKYRKDALKMLMEKHKKMKNIKKWLEQNKSFKDKETIEQLFGFDLSKTDSLMKFSFFREYLNNISKYDLEFIEENNGNSGGFYIDSRIRFDSILKDKRFNQTAKNFLLFNAYNGIGQNFRVKDKEEYFKKLQENITNIEQLNKLEKDFKLDFSKSDKLVLTNLKKDTLTFSSLLKNNKGKWLYIDFWASWCTPCRKTMPESNKLKKELEKENIEFIYLSLNDKKENWKKAIESDGIADSQNYFIENGNVSKVIEKLGIKTIPHYLIYSPSGKLVNGFANRPGKGAKEELIKLITEK
ncbi:TlpA disulfide reductase family protein [Flavivirga aquimarina]|uniref:TlpA disulfide reductase family protein n=1 Tax=Flavivirga aquimarina TaxID=2027862 RepID=A0ABT8W9P2_9FLAO|nr:TlpA disulfide reductase family protein [Flavivirga aquimarina]MDO5969774.1 TlpA disulfide reductase family protein [Flavivirga aquimarina]